MMSQRVRWVIAAVLCSAPAILVWMGPAPQSRQVTAAESSSSVQSLARPVGLAFLHRAQRLLVANRDSGSITTIDPAQQRVLSHSHIAGAEQLSAMIVSADERYVLTCSRTLNRAWLLERVSDSQLTVLETISVPAGPVGLNWVHQDQSGLQAAISCQWGRAVAFLKFDPAATPGSRLTTRATVSLPFSPRRILPFQDGARVIVADAFGGLMSVINTESAVVERTKKLPGHNLHGLGMMPDQQRVIVAQQILNPVAETSRDSVFWGIVMTNNIRLIPIENFLQDDRQLLQDADIHFLGEPNHGAGDPTDIAMGRYDIMLTTLGGVDELAVGVHLDHSFDRVKVGRNPVAVVTDTTGNTAYVANQFSDSVSVVEIKSRKVVAELSVLERPQDRPLTLAEQGEILFHDANLSLDGWYSCHSCHTSGHTAGLLNDNLGDGNYGAPKRIPSLLGVAGTAPFLWSGRRNDLGEQTRKSITTTMHGESPKDDQISALVAYMTELAPPPRIEPADPDQATRGKKLFDARGCNVCHAAPTYTSADVYDVGLQDQQGRNEFNPPSLRGVRYRGPFFHDLRAANLTDVFTQHKHPAAAEWTKEELADLIAFLESL